MNLHLIPVYKYYAPNPWRFLYSSDPDIRNGWTRAGISFFAFGSNQDGTTPVYRYVAPNPSRYLYSTNPNVAQGWAREGIAFYAFKEANTQIGTMPINQLRAIDQNPWRYQYATQGSSTGDGWEFDNLAFHVFSAQPAA